MTFGSYFCDGTVLSGNIWQELEPEPKLWTKVEPEPKIDNFGPATLPVHKLKITSKRFQFCQGIK